MSSSIKTFGEYLRRSVQLHPQVTAVDDGKRRWSFTELAARSKDSARVLAASGVGAGSRVGIVARNRAETVALYFACARLGAVLVPLNWRLQSAELSRIIAHAELDALIAEDAFLENLTENKVPEQARITLDNARDGWRSLEELRGSAGPLPCSHTGRSCDVVIQMYTSGTTGHPKGALITHENVTSLVDAWLLDMHLEPARSRFLQVTPLFHVGGMLMMMSTVASGSTLRLLPEFEPVTALEVLNDEPITHALFVPAMIQWMLLEIDSPAANPREFKNLELIVYGASPMPVPVLERAIDVFRCDFLQGYGLTESAGVLLSLRPEDHRFEPGTPPPKRLGSAGRAVTCSEVHVVDEHGAQVAPGAIGEIIARGPNITPGYWKDEVATAEVLVDGWFHTGDLATVDEEGFIYIVDRKKDMILVGGENVYPREIEDELIGHEGVAEAAVIGIPHDVFGEEVLAYVVPRPEASHLEGRALIRFCRERLARFKCPTRIELMDSLPRTPAGKLQKKILREPFWKGRARRI